jgi:acyl-CoA dehydrogenase
VNVSYLIDDDMKMLRESAARLFAGADTVRTLRRLRDARDLAGLARGVWPAMSALGLAGILVPEAYGGAGLGARTSTQVAETMGVGLATGPFIASAVMGATAVLAGENEALKDRLLPDVAAGGTVLALAAEETERHRPDQIRTVARREGRSYRLSGRKVAVIGGNLADWLVVAAQDDAAGGLGLFLVDAHAAGLAFDLGIGIDSHPTVNVTLSEVTVDSGSRIAGPEHADTALERALDAGRLHLAAEMLGVAQEAFDRTVDYLKTRVQFGKKIGEFQALQHRAAILLGEIEIARSVVMKAASLWDEGDAAAKAYVSLAKARLGDIARRVTTEAVQLHGGIGMTDDFDIGLFLKRARAASELLGDGAFHAERWARLQGM